MRFWQHKRVVVTGGAGFLGQYVVAQLQEKKKVLSVEKEDVLKLMAEIETTKKDVFLKLALESPVILEISARTNAVFKAFSVG